MPSTLDVPGPGGRDGDAVTPPVAPPNSGGRAPVLRAAIPAIEGFALVLSMAADEIDAQLPGVLADDDPECLHQLRVAVRRSRSVIRDARSVVAPDVLDVGRRAFTWIGHLTAPVRDLDVQLAGWDDLVERLAPGAGPALEPVHAVIEHWRADVFADLAESLADGRAVDALGTWRLQLDGITAGQGRGRRADRSLGRVVGRRLAVSHRRVVERGRAIGPESPDSQLHELRKDAKRLRYLLECFGPMFPPRPLERCLRQLRPLQNTLGAHQDACVQITSLELALGEVEAGCAADDTVLAVRNVVERLERIRSMTRTDFEARFAHFDRKKTRRAVAELGHRASS